MKAENGLKKCSKCGEVKKLVEYGIHKSRADGLCNYCKQCKSLIDKEYRIHTIDRHRENNKSWWRLSRLRILSEQKGIRESMGCRYIKIKLSQNFGIKFRDIPPKMIELKRTQLINKRLIKNLKENETE